MKSEEIHVRRQAPIGPYVADFVVFAQKLIIEIDGPDHGFAARQQHDQKRDSWLSAQGFEVVRYSVAEIDDNLEGVVTDIRLHLGLETTGYPHP